ncbi:MAG TPA: T9SS type A sorting domain-containing protein [Bacteroidia bacterium]|nr:T9SS type A sorting domain-containing protein [Bacteroidia bacterium]
MKLLFSILSLFCLTFSSTCFAQNQGINNNWILGYDSEWGLPFGITKMDFFSGTPTITYDSLEMEFNHTHANISDDQGNLLFYTNGVYIADATNDTMLNGSGINPGAYANFVPDGLLISQGVLALKKPGSSNLFYLFHNTADDYPNSSISFHLYLSVIDMNLNNGLGQVILKNYPLINDSLNPGKITSCKHANGRDWWIICHRVNSDKYYKLLLTPYGLPQVSTQNIGAIRPTGGGQAKFSYDGNYFGYFYNLGGLDLFQFDRCSGTFTNIFNDTNFTSPGIQKGLEFSPNSQFLYVCNTDQIFQYDLASTNILSSKMIVAQYDSFLNPPPFQLGTYFAYPLLAPDGKIYITTGNGTFYMHTIDQPDQGGMACSVSQHSVQLPAFYFNTIPNHPNFFLGALAGSPCDTLVGVGINEEPEIILKVFPNPASDFCTLSFPVKAMPGEIEVTNVLGEIILKETVAPWSQFKRIAVGNFSAGVYHCRLRWGTEMAVVKFVKE